MTYVIAEIGSNHDGSLNQAIDLISDAKAAGADAVKFQCLPNLPRDWLPDLKPWTDETGIDLFATPFDVDAVRYLIELGVPYLKIASVEIIRRDLIQAAAENGIPLLISTGMATLSEIRDAIDWANWGNKASLTLLQCTTQYPTPPSNVHLRAMVSINQAFGLPVGLSDHSTSIAIPAAAVALGATVIEKHITLDRTLPGPDHPFALEPDEFAAMVRGIREVEEAMGDSAKNGPRVGEMVELRERRLQWQV